MSGPTCSTCADKRRPEIDAALVSGDSLRDIAGQFGTSRSALSRHRPHVGKAIVRAAEARQDAEAETLLQKIERLEADARRIGERAEAEGDLRAALVAVDKLLDVTKLMHELMPRPAPDLRAVAERYAAAAGCSADELLELAEKMAQGVDGKGAQDFGLLRAIESAAIAARELPAAAPAPSAPVAPTPFRMSV